MIDRARHAKREISIEDVQEKDLTAFSPASSDSFEFVKKYLVSERAFEVHQVLHSCPKCQRTLNTMEESLKVEEVRKADSDIQVIKK